VTYVDVSTRIAELRALADTFLHPVPGSDATAADGFAAALDAAGVRVSEIAPGMPDDVAALLEQLRAAAPDSLAATLLSPARTGAGAGLGPRMLELARAEVGQREEPAGSNDGPRIAEYRTAVAGAYAGGGEGAVDGVAAWAAGTGRLLPAGSAPQPGDVILYGSDHVGIVESVNPDGSLTTIEGNHRNAVERVRRSPVEATGYVRV
jgi:hypothetical protein